MQQAAMTFSSSSNNKSSNDALMLADHDKAKEGNNNNNNNNDFLEPLKGIKDTFQRVGKIFYARGISILGPSSIAIGCWYLAAIGIRAAFAQWSLQSSEYRTIEISGEEYGYQWEPMKVTISRIGLCLELLLVFLFHCPAEATTILTIANLYASDDNDNDNDNDNNNNNNNSGSGEGGEQTNNNNNQATSNIATTFWDRAAGIFTTCSTTIQIFLRLIMNRRGGSIGTLLMACLLWCLVLLLPMCLLIWILAPEAPYYYENIQWLYLPYWPKLFGGGLYLVYSTIFILITYFLYPIILLEQNQPIRNNLNNNSQANSSIFDLVVTSFRQSYEIMKIHWKFVTPIVLIWFVIKFIITKIAMGLNMMYYLHDFRVYQVWYMLGIPLHPIRILYSNIDLWEFGRSWISVPFVIVIAAFGSIFKTVLYFDARVKQEQDGSYKVGMLQQELHQVVGSPDQVVGSPDQGAGEATPYTSMMEEGMEKKQNALAAEIV